MSEARDYEVEARADGWAPEDEWKGDADKKPKEFVSAEEFVKRGEGIARNATRQKDKLADEVAQLQSDMEGMRATNAEYGRMRDDQLKREKKRTEDAIAELEETRAKAVTDGDGETFTKTDREIKELESQQPAETNPEAERMRAAFQSQNDWYGTDEVMTGYADGIFQKIIKEGYEGQAYWNELAARTKKAFPDKFQNKARDEVGYEAGGRQESDPKPKSWDALPADAKAACDRFIKSGIVKDRETYLTTYEWDE